jgi:hypothetical protein
LVAVFFVAASAPIVASPSDDTYFAYCIADKPDGRVFVSMYSDVFSMREADLTAAAVRASDAFRNWLHRNQVETVGHPTCWVHYSLEETRESKKKTMDGDGRRTFDTHWKFVAGDEDDHKPR